MEEENQSNEEITTVNNPINSLDNSSQGEYSKRNVNIEDNENDHFEKYDNDNKNETEEYKEKETISKQPLLPSDILRYTMKANGDMSSRRLTSDKRTYLGALKYLPHAIYKIFENIPMPWEHSKQVNVIYHITGALTYIDEVPKVIEPVFFAQWGTMWIAMRNEKFQRGRMNRVSFPIFDDENPPIDFVQQIEEIGNVGVVRLDLDDEEDGAVKSWLYERNYVSENEYGDVFMEEIENDNSENFNKSNGNKNKNQKIMNESKKKWKLSNEQLSTLQRLSQQLIGDVDDMNYYYLFNKESFFNAKSLNVTLIGGPRYEPLFRDNENDDDWNEFDDINKVIVRRVIRTEYKVAYPFLYAKRPREIHVIPYHYPMQTIIKSNEPDIPIFHFDELLYQLNNKEDKYETKQLEEIQTDKMEEENSENDLNENEDEITFYDDIIPFGNDIEYEDENIREGLNLIHAKYPFNEKYGHTKRAQDIPLIKNWYLQHVSNECNREVRVSHQRLLKVYVLNELKTSHQKTKAELNNLNEFNKNNLKDKTKSFGSILKENPTYFNLTQLDWVEAGLQLVQQGHNILNLLIHRKNVDFLHLDYNFNLKPIRTLTTKERKKSRFGNSFHLMREVLKLTKCIVDIHALYRMGKIDCYVLADGIQYIFGHVGTLTGMYRYKYKVIQQIRQCKALKQIIKYRFNTNNIGKGPGVGFWQPLWRVWVFLLRGFIPILERWLGNLLARSFEGRKAKAIAKNITKQREESGYDIELRAAVLHEINEIMPSGMKENKSKVIMQHLSEAWRCWKANIPWKVPGLPVVVENMILKYVKKKADWWTDVAYYTREQIRNGAKMEKTATKKNLGRLSRLYLKSEQERQNNYLKEGPYVSTTEGIEITTMMFHWLQNQQFQPIPFPPQNYKYDTKLLVLALENLKESFSQKTRMNQSEREELGLIEQAFDAPHEILTRIKRQLLTQRTFKEVKIDFVDMYTHLTPKYEFDPMEKIVDSYLDQYLWYEGEKRHLFPNWIKPSDTEPAPLLVYKFCQGMNNLKDIWKTDNGECNVMVETTLEKMVKKIDFTLLNSLLKKIMDPILADYITAKNNITISFKDMMYTNSYGLIEGLPFSSFIVQFYGLVMDLLILGPQRALEIAGTTVKPNEYLTFANKEIETHHPIRMYTRYIDKVYILYRFNEEESHEIVNNMLIEHPDPNNENRIGYPNKKCWPKDCRMRLNRIDVNIGKATFWLLSKRLPKSLTTIEWENSCVTVYSKNNPNALFTMCGFEVRIQPKCMLLQTNNNNLNNFNNRNNNNNENDEIIPGEIQPIISKENVWELKYYESMETTAYAYLKVSHDEIVKFENRIKLISMSSNATTFTKIAAKWNTAIIGLMMYFREAVLNSQELLDIIVKCENKIQTRIKLGLNSKMPDRFPPVVFYTPKELGGLGMMSMGHILIPQSDLQWSRQTDIGVQAFRAGLSHKEDQTIPNLMRYIVPWEREFKESQKVWIEYAQKRKLAIEENRRITLDDLEDSWDKGIPRINTLFQQDRNTLAYDKGWRIRLEFSKYRMLKNNTFWWTNPRHDGKLWNLNNYRKDMIDALGGIECILEHTLFRATYFKHWEGLFWEKTNAYENSVMYKKMTVAQRGGLSQIPNRRFTLWWSPTINRGSVYVGFETQLDLTGIFMQGKIPNLKISLIQIFRAHLWQKIHESIVMDLCQILDRQIDNLDIEKVQKEPIHPRKSYKMNSSCADILLIANNQWESGKASYMTDTTPITNKLYTNKFWIDVQLKWGDFDQHNIDSYTRLKYETYANNSGSSFYPSETGIIIAFDLAYNTYAAYGRWIPGMKELMSKALTKILDHNIGLFVLRERIRKSLQLYTSQPHNQSLSSHNYGELFNDQTTWFVDASNIYRVKIHKTIEGNYITKPLNGIIMIFNPRTGLVYLKILHSSEWEGKKRIGQLKYWKTADEVVKLIKDLPIEEQPKTIVMAQKELIDPMETHMIDFPNIVLKKSEIRFPFTNIMQMEKVNEIVSNAQESKTVLFNMYDNWTESVTPYAAFHRTILLLRAFTFTPIKAKKILQTPAEQETPEQFQWPNYSDNEWKKREIELKDVIIEEYAKKNNISVKSLTQNEIRDIILGMKIRVPSKERQQIAEIEGETGANQQGIAVTTKTQNKFQQTVTTTTTTPYEQQIFISSLNWRERAARSSEWITRMGNVEIISEGDDIPIVIPKNLLKGMIKISDTKTQIGGILYGKENKHSKGIFEIHCIVIVPQSGTNQYVEFSKHSPQSNELQGLIPLGWIHTVSSNSSNNEFTHYDAMVHTSLMNTYGIGNICIAVGISSGSITVKGYLLNENGKTFGEEHTNLLQPIEELPNKELAEMKSVVITDKINGFFLIPERGSWNYSLSQSKFALEVEYGLKIGIPFEFYHEDHRRMHFTAWVQSDNLNGFDNDKNELENGDYDSFY